MCQQVKRSREVVSEKGGVVVEAARPQSAALYTNCRGADNSRWQGGT
jgi:hypothetical protein